MDRRLGGVVSYIPGGHLGRIYMRQATCRYILSLFSSGPSYRICLFSAPSVACEPNTFDFFLCCETLKDCLV